LAVVGPQDTPRGCNAALAGLARDTIAGFRAAIATSGIDAPLYLTQNDGTVMSADMAMALPVMSFASGATNSMRGAAFLSGIQDAIVVDVGGTSTDIGQLRHGFPREANSVVEIGEVRTLFRMPDLFSLALGGGSIVSPDPLAVGPHSVGYRLTEAAMVFGGRTITATDCVAAAGIAEIGDKALAKVPPALAAAVLDRARAMIEDAVDRMKTEAARHRSRRRPRHDHCHRGRGHAVRLSSGECAEGQGASGGGDGWRRIAGLRVRKPSPQRAPTLR
jgi:N-methylhydantoinase A/oxoprolinase/acetone carboxylase beta subunit